MRNTAAEAGRPEAVPGAEPARIGRGHRRGHAQTVPLAAGGPKGRRPAPAPPMAGASRPPGQAPASGIALGWRSCRSLVAAGGERQCLSFSARCNAGTGGRNVPARRVRACTHRSGRAGREGAWGPRTLRPHDPAIAGVTRLRFPLPAGGPKGRRPAPARPMAGASRPPGRALASVWRVEAVLWLPERVGRGRAVPFLFRPSLPERTGRPWTRHCFAAREVTLSDRRYSAASRSAGGGDRKRPASRPDR